MTISAISQHLRKLKDRKLIETEGKHKPFFYSLTKRVWKNAQTFFKILHENKILETIWKQTKKLIGAGLWQQLQPHFVASHLYWLLLQGQTDLFQLFSWLEPFRPYFIGLTILVLGFAWYQKLKPKNKLTAIVRQKKNQNSFNPKCF